LIGGEIEDARVWSSLKEGTIGEKPTSATSFDRTTPSDARLRIEVVQRDAVDLSSVWYKID
jgi:hypothetical protein